MAIMYKITIILLFLIGSVNGFSQRRHHIHLPDLPGYKTLKCDLHTHTIFSDGRLWPDVRVEEAWRDGLDAIALTDHINYKSPIIRKYLKCEDENAAYNEALFIARQLGVTLIKGAEINMSKDIGHFNVLFMDDLNEIKVVDKDYLRSLRKAKKKEPLSNGIIRLVNGTRTMKKCIRKDCLMGLRFIILTKSISMHANGLMTGK